MECVGEAGHLIAGGDRNLAAGDDDDKSAVSPCQNSSSSCTSGYTVEINDHQGNLTFREVSPAGDSDAVEQSSSGFLTRVFQPIVAGKPRKKSKEDCGLMKKTEKRAELPTVTRLVGSMLVSNRGEDEDSRVQSNSTAEKEGLVKHKKGKMAKDLVIEVKTGDKRGAGTDCKLWVVLHEDHNRRTSPIRLSNRITTNCRGQSCRFVVSSQLPHTSNVGLLEFWLEKFGLGELWFVETFTIWILDEETSSRINPKKVKLARELGTVFPVMNWVDSSHGHRFITPNDISLPQDTLPCIRNQRTRIIEEKRQRYRYRQVYPGAPVQVAELPSDEKFSDEYYWTFATDKLKLLAQSKMINWTTSKWKTLDLLKSVYKLSLGEPEPISYWKEDWWFGLQRVQGVNPMIIKHCKCIPDKLDVTQDTVEGLLEDFTLQEALKKNRLFICDLAIVDGLPCNNNRKLAAPMALFYLNKKNDLLPVAIQTMQQKGPENPVYTPKDSPNTWLLAKLFYNNAEAQHHQGVTHLGYTHLLMEGVCVCTHRNLSPSHPMFKLMAPHFLFLLAINSRGLEKLVSPGGWVDNCMTQGVTGIFELMKRGFKEWKYDVHAIPETEIEARGVLNPDILPYYPYRDDAVSLFKVIKKYVTRIVNHHYDSPEKLQKDWEIHAWRKELAAPRGESGVGLDSLPGGENGFTSVQEVIDVIAFIISTCSLGHATSNFQQYEQYGFVPNYPGILFKDPPTQKCEYTEADLLSLLPDMAMTLDIMVITKLLSSRGTNSLGNFEMQYFYDPLGISAAEEFRKDLQKLSLDIQKRNIDRQIKYPWLDPAIVPNAISV